MSTCPRCQAQFGCANVDGPRDQPCWCMSMPVLPKEALVLTASGELQSCFCPACLQEMTRGLSPRRPGSPA